MGTLIGHVAPGFGFLAIGLWHLFANVRIYCANPGAYVAPPWLPSPLLHRHLELLLIIAGSVASISMELFLGPAAHQPLDDDGTIPANHLHNFQHAAISLAFLTYAATAIALDRARPRLRDEMTFLLAAAAFAQQLLMFRLHSADHTGVEGQYHWLLQLVVAVSLAGTLLGVRYRRSLAVSFVRSASIAFQGVWFIVMGYALWTPSLIPWGCFMNMEEGHLVVRCRSEAALGRAKALVNLLFSCCMTSMVIFSACLYLFLDRVYSSEKAQYEPLSKQVTATTEEDDDLESTKTIDGRILRP